jgi:hypothetical protein
MHAPDNLIQAVRSVLNTKARAGQTTKRDATIMVMKKIESAGGPTKFGIGAAAMRMALQSIIEGEVTRQLKMGLTDHETEFRLPSSTPREIVAALGKVPRWLAISEGSEAYWVFSLQATPEHWSRNAALKEKKAQQTLTKANVSLDIARFLAMHRYGSLSEVLMKGV